MGSKVSAIVGAVGVRQGAVPAMVTSVTGVAFAGNKRLLHKLHFVYRGRTRNRGGTP